MVACVPGVQVILEVRQTCQRPQARSRLACLFLRDFARVLCFASGAGNATGKAAKTSHHSPWGFTAFVRAAPQLN